MMMLVGRGSPEATGGEQDGMWGQCFGSGGTATAAAVGGMHTRPGVALWVEACSWRTSMHERDGDGLRARNQDCRHQNGQPDWLHGVLNGMLETRRISGDACSSALLCAGTAAALAAPRVAAHSNLTLGAAG